MIVSSINRRLLESEHLKQKVKKSFALKIPGMLIVRESRSNPRYYIRLNNKEKYLNKTDIETIELLSQKRYDIQLLSALSAETKSLKDCLEELSKSPDPDFLYESLDDSLKQHVSRYEGSDEDYARKWASQNFRQGMKSDNHTLETLGKDLVRSKSEVIIADRLFSRNIPYRYEELLRLEYGFDVLNYYPDFTILNKRTREVFYWEHLGKMGDENYSRKNLQKLDVYAHNGIIQGKNLILTYECEGKQLSTEMVDICINTFLV